MSETYNEKRYGWRFSERGGPARFVEITKQRYTPDAQNRRDREADQLGVRLGRATRWAQGEGVLEAVALTLEKGLNLVGIAPGLNPLRSAGMDVDPRVMVGAMEAAVHASRWLRMKYLGRGYSEAKEEINRLLSPYVDGTPDPRKRSRRFRR